MWVAAPGVHRMGRAARWQVKGLLGLGAGTIAAAAMGLAVGSLGEAVPSPVRAGVTTVAGVALAVAIVTRSPLPQFDRETPQSLLNRGPLVWATANGALLGLGLTNRIGFWLWYLIPIATFAMSSPVLGAALWGTYGFARLGILLVASMMMRRNEQAPHTVSARLLGARAHVRPALTVLAFVAGIATAVSAGL